MWKCPICNRTFERKGQSHSCKTVSIEEHFRNKELANEIFDQLFDDISNNIGSCEITSLPCCVHLFGKYDFLAALPKRDRLEIRFGLNRELSSSRIKQSVPTSLTSYKHCLDLRATTEIDKELLNWLAEAYHLKDEAIRW
jgi:hypothetical protein